jgi:hypothetical protein
VDEWLNGSLEGGALVISTPSEVTTQRLVVLGEGWGYPWYDPSKYGSLNSSGPMSTIGVRLLLEWISGRMLSMCLDWLGS